MEIKDLIYYYTRYCGVISIQVDSDWSYNYNASSTRKVIGIGLYDYHRHKDFDGDVHIKVKQDTDKQYFIDVYYPNTTIIRSKCSSVKTICFPC
ncbi:MAG: hypothetical protein VZS44_08710 [Bacilli bacterium]|nr:hypothetical protein [Bacilli bacterium]